MRYRFLAFELDTLQRALRGPQGPIALRRRSWDVLLYLLEHAPAAVGKDELLDAVWGHDAVSPGVIAQTVRELRDALDDDPATPRLIRTRHRHGYQFIAPVQCLADEAAGAVPAQAPDPSTALPASVRSQPARRAALRSPAAVVVVVGVLLLVAVLLAVARPWTWQAATPDAAALQQAHRASWVFDDAAALRALQRGGEASSVDAELLRARLAIARADADAARQALARVRAHAGALQRAQELHAEVLTALLAARVHDALQPALLLHGLQPDDIDAALLLLDLQQRAGDEDTDATLATLLALDGLPGERRLLLAAQQAGRRGEHALQADQARAAMAAAGTRLPVLADLARVQLAQSERAGGNAAAAAGLLREALAGLQRSGRLDHAAEVAIALAGLDLQGGDHAAAAAALDALANRLDASAQEAGQGATQGSTQGAMRAAVRARLLHARGQMARRSGDHVQALALFTAAEQQHAALGDAAGAAAALNAMAGPLRALGRSEQARQVLQRALEHASGAGAEGLLAGVHGNLANFAAREGHPADAERHYRAALDLFRSTGDRGAQAVTLGNLGNLAIRRGDARGGEALQQQALELFVQLQRDPDAARLLLGLAAAALVRGDLDAADTQAARAATLFERLQRPEPQAMALALRADVLLRRAEPIAAARLLDQAPPVATDAWAAQAVLATLRGWVARESGDAAAARAAHQQALDLRQRLDERSLARASQLDLLRLDLDAGNAGAVEQGALQLAVQASQDANPGDERTARLLLAEALQLQGRSADAGRALAAARQLLDAAPDFDAELQWALQQARLDLDRGDRRERLHWVWAQAQERGHQLRALEAQGALLVEGPGTDTGAADRAGWLAELDRRGLARLARARLAIAR